MYLPSSVKKVLRPTYRRLKRFLAPPLHEPSQGHQFRVFGTEYGCWPVLNGSLTEGSVVYSFGVGTDISFDLELIRNFRCAVFAFDPTPHSVSRIAQQVLPEKFFFFSVGISDSVGNLYFAPPERDGFVSYSAAGSKRSSAKLTELPVKPLDVIMKSHQHNSIDLMKMDVEGSEYSVIRDMIKKKIYPKQLCIEFHHGMYGFSNDDTREAVSLLRDAGYQLHYVSFGGREYGFHHARLADINGR